MAKLHYYASIFSLFQKLFNILLKQDELQIIVDLQQLTNIPALSGYETKTRQIIELQFQMSRYHDQTM